jgi:hypothetical protein
MFIITYLLSDHTTYPDRNQYWKSGVFLDQIPKNVEVALQPLNRSRLEQF